MSRFEEPAGVLALARPTFDMDCARANIAAMQAALAAAGVQPAGSFAPLTDTEAAVQAAAKLAGQGIGRLLILQATFTDAEAVLAAAGILNEVPLTIWAVPEPRAGGRLRLNSLCGLNLAAHALTRAGRPYSWLYAAPDAPDLGGRLAKALHGAAAAASPELLPAAAPDQPAAAALRGRRIGRIGAHPAGFATCRYDADALRSLAGVEVVELELGELFAAAGQADAEQVAELRQQAGRQLSGLDDVDQPQLDKSLRLKLALDELRARHRIDAFALRCWPEAFTEYGGAVCGPAAMLGEQQVPCACEADVYGALTQLILQQAAGAPVFLADIVDVDAADDSAVLWHCGQAPPSLAAAPGRARATIHTNRRMPLLYEFALKAGEATMMRVSQAQAQPVMLLAHGQVLARPAAFTGTSGVVRFDAPAGRALANILDWGMEHHIALAYGDHRAALQGAAAALGLPVAMIG